MSVTLTGVATPLITRPTPTVDAPAGADFPSAASNNQPDQELLNHIASLMAHAGLLDVASTWNQQQTFQPPVLHYIGDAGEAAFQNSWHNSGSATLRPHYYKTQDGIVHLGGQLGGGNNGTIAFTLPAGFRPAATTIGPTTALTTGGAQHHGLVSVTASGDVQITGDSTYGSGAISSVYLTGMQFHPGAAAVP